MKQYAYYPGCSLEHSASPYDKSIREVFRVLEIGLTEIEDWNCCGATMYMSVKKIVATAISARNLAIAQKMGMEICAPCSSCYTILRKANRSVDWDPKERAMVNEALAAADLSYTTTVEVKHPLDILTNDIGLDAIKAKVKNPLTGLRVAPYYGCQIVRPHGHFDDVDDPVTMDKLFTALGATVTYFPAKVRCCGGMLMTTQEEIALDLNLRLLEVASDNNADIIATACPLCQMNLEAYQNKINARSGKTFNIPVVYFSHLLGVALGIDPRKDGHGQIDDPRGEADCQGRGGERMTNDGNGSRPKNADDIRIGVYVCHCGSNIAKMVDVAKVVETAAAQPNVVIARHYRFMCSDPGQELIQKDIKEFNLNRVVVAACSPLMHESTFRKAVETGGVNRYFFEMANIREQVSWVTTDAVGATRKAQALVRAAVARVRFHEPLEMRRVPITKQVMIVGGGIAGIEAALQIADAGYKVILVERDSTIGGHMSKFDKTFPTLDCAACILTPKMVSVGKHPNIKLMTWAEIESVSGYIGNFKVAGAQ